MGIQNKSLRLMGRKRGMTQLFDEKGNLVVCTVIEIEPNVVTQLKNEDTDGYQSIQLGFEKRKEEQSNKRFRRLTKALEGHFKKSNIAPRRFLKECRVVNEGYSVGQEIGVEEFKDVAFVDVAGVSKGKGFQGTIKRHGFAGGPAAHGSGFHRAAGSTGMRSTPGRCLPGGKRAGHMGDRNVTTQNLRVFQVCPEKKLLLVKGCIPGPKGGLVVVTRSVKKHS